MRAGPSGGRAPASGGRAPAPPAKARPASIRTCSSKACPTSPKADRLDVVERLADALTSVPGVFLLDRTSDASHNRSVFTVAGEHDAVSTGLERLVEQAVADIDMEGHTGEHPRIGAVDVIPFIPLGDTTMAACVDLARAFGARIATRHDIPVYLYARAAARADRVKLSDVRRGQYEGLRARDRPERSPAGLRARPDASAVWGRGGRGQALPDRLEHQPRLG